MELLKLIPSTSTCPSDLLRSSHFQSWSGVSNWVVSKVCYVLARLGEVPAFGNLHQLCRGAAWGSELED